MLSRASARKVLQVRNVSSYAVTYSRLGGPLSSGEVQVGDKLAASQVLVKVVAAPVSSLDLHSIAGRVPGMSSSGVCGNEAFGEVVEVGSGVTGVKKGDKVVAAKLGLGSWSNYAVADASSVAVVPADVDAEQAATFGGSPATALRVLSDLGGLKSGDCVIHDGAESVFGAALVQIAKAKGLKVISVVNEGALDIKKVSQALKAAGSAVVIDEGSAGSSDFRKVCGELSPKLAIHSSPSADAATNLARALAPGGVLVSVGGAGPVTVPSSLLIDRGVTVQGFNLAKALSADKGKDTLQELVSMSKAGKLKIPVAATESLSNYTAAIDAALGNPGSCVLFKM